MEDDDVRRIQQLLAHARPIVGQGEACLRCDTELLETVYIERSWRSSSQTRVRPSCTSSDGRLDVPLLDEGVAADARARHDVVVVAIDDEDGAGAVIEAAFDSVSPSLPSSRR